MLLRRVNYLSPFKELVIPLLKAHQICCLVPRLIPLFLSPWHLTSPLQFTEISAALVESSRVMGKTCQQSYSNECEITGLESRIVVSGDGWGWVLAADGCGQVGTIHQSWSFSCLWLVYARDILTIWPMESEKIWLPLRRTKWWFGFQSWFLTPCWQIPSWNPWWISSWRRRKMTITIASSKALVRLGRNGAGVPM